MLNFAPGEVLPWALCGSKSSHADHSDDDDGTRTPERRHVEASSAVDSFDAASPTASSYSSEGDVGPYSSKCEMDELGYRAEGSYVSSLVGPSALLKQLKQKLAADRGCRPGPLPEPGAPVFTRNFRPGPPWSAGEVLSPASASSLLVRMPDGNTWHRHADHVRPRLVTEPATLGTTSEGQPAGGPTATPVAASEAPEAASVASCAAPVEPLPSSAPFSRPVTADPPDGAQLAQGAPGVATPGSSTPVPRRSTRQRRPLDCYSPG
ncbi:hypothetical protein HPB49_000329 [Dermacentor silvarum]|uniref:Uncharacterized protein n=1 Tax=Dermacentor silvarum TaxID=543639 RepID=A0ACB8C1D1_DERSI|nr:hypothetical protein HPB49_000329 [Dermacentor silvarum]